MVDETYENPPPKKRHWLWLFAFVGMGLVLVYIWQGEPQRPFTIAPIYDQIQAEDIRQHRLNTPIPTPNETIVATQTFVPLHDGLTEIELILARNSEPAADENGRLYINLFDAQNNLLVTRTLETKQFSHNHTYQLTIPRQANPAGQTYRLQLSGNADNPLTVWGYDADSYTDGTFTVPEGVETAVKDLRFVTRYQLAFGQAITQATNDFLQNMTLFVLLVAFLLMPGTLILLLAMPWLRWDPLAWLGAALAVGTAVWPIIWYLFSLIGGRFSGWLLWVLLLAGWTAVLTIWWRQKRSFKQMFSRWRWQHTVMMLILFVGIGVRLLAVRDINVPPWVDASRHALITAVMVENGRTLLNYQPYLPIDRFPYHFGFHTLSASLMLMGNWALERLLLFMGQFINGLLPLVIFSGTWLMARRRNASLIAAFLVTIPFFFPAYYATWGPFTQLTAMFIMPVLLALTWLMVRGAKRWRTLWWVVALLAAGVFLVHFRVFVFYIPFAVVLFLFSWGRNGRYLFASGVLGGLLVLPRILSLNSQTEPIKSLGYNLPGYNDFPIGYFEAGWDRFFVWLAGILFLLVVIALLRKRAWAWLPLIFTIWVASLFLLLAGDYLNLPSTSIVNLNSMYITLFLPLAIYLGVVLDRLWGWLQQGNDLVRVFSYVLPGGLITAVTIFGVRQQITILNPTTILVWPQDVAALDWLDENVPLNANVAVGSWLWLGETYAAADGGAWIVPLTRRSSSTPPADYNYDRDLFEKVNGFNEIATAVTDWSDHENINWLQEQDITHIFIGAKGGFIDPAALLKTERVTPLYAQDGVFIFEIN